MIMSLNFSPPSLLVAIRRGAGEPRVHWAPLPFRLASEGLVVGDGLGPAALARHVLKPWLIRLTHEYGRSS